MKLRNYCFHDVVHFNLMEKESHQPFSEFGGICLRNPTFQLHSFLCDVILNF